MPVWTEDDGSTTNYLDKQVDLEAGTTYRIRNSSSTDLFTIVESTGVITSLGGLTVSGDVNGASASEMAHLSGLSTNIVTALAGKADKANVLELDNTSAFTPSADYHPATKKYVLDNSGGASGTDWTIDQTSTYTFHVSNIPSGSPHYSTLALGTTASTALAGDTTLLAIGTTSSTALAGDTAYSTLALGTTSSTALAGDTAYSTLALGTSSTTALAGDTAYSTLALGTSSTTALAGDTDITSVDKDALESALLAIDTNITIGSTVDIDTTISGDLTVIGTVNGIDIATDVAANNDKLTNVSTTLSIGTASFDVVNITSDGGDDDVTIPTATTGTAGVMSKTIYDQWLANTFHVNSSHAPADSLSKSAGGTMGADINMADNAIGFTQFEPTYNSSDTEVHFDDYGNKAFATFGAGNITDLNLYFPDFSCNCVLLLKQDATGSRTVTYFKTFDQADGNESTVQFAGGLNPTLTATANKIDIISFYWDNDNHKAYGTITKNF